MNSSNSLQCINNTTNTNNNSFLFKNISLDKNCDDNNNDNCNILRQNNSLAEQNYMISYNGSTRTLLPKIAVEPIPTPYPTQIYLTDIYNNQRNVDLEIIQTSQLRTDTPLPTATDASIEKLNNLNNAVAKII